MANRKFDNKGKADRENPPGVNLNGFFVDFYDALKSIARCELGRVRVDSSMTATVLVNECYLKLRCGSGKKKLNKAHFFQLAARCMRFQLIDLIRRGQCDKRQARETILQASRITGEDCLLEDLIDLDRALTRLREVDAELVDLVELRLFLGLNLQEISQLTGASVSQIHRRWTVARALLSNFLGCDGAHDVQ